MGDVRTQGQILEGLVYCQVTAEVAAQGAIVATPTGMRLRSPFRKGAGRRSAAQMGLLGEYRDGAHLVPGLKPRPRWWRCRQYAARTGSRRQVRVACCRHWLSVAQQPPDDRQAMAAPAATLAKLWRRSGMRTSVSLGDVLC